MLISSVDIISTHYLSNPANVSKGPPEPGLLSRFLDHVAIGIKENKGMTMVMGLIFGASIALSGGLIVPAAAALAAFVVECQLAGSWSCMRGRAIGLPRC